MRDKRLSLCQRVLQYPVWRGPLRFHGGTGCLEWTMKMALLLLLMVSACSAQTYTAYGITFPQAHPRLWFNDATRLSRARTWASANPTYNPGTVDQYSTYQTVINNAWFHVASGGTWSCANAVNWAVNFQTVNTYVPKH